MQGLALFAAVTAAFNTVFLDQFGVLHDGRTPYPGALEALRLLRDRGTRTVVLSNSGRSGTMNAHRMAELGIAQDLYDHFLTSGDVACQLLAGGAGPVNLAHVKRCLTIASANEHEIADRLGLATTDSADDADLLIIAGSQGETVSLETYAAILAPAARRGVPCICTNPDRHALGKNGLFAGAGAIAERYASLGGPVTFIGKPYRAMYDAALQLADAQPADVLCIGDSIEHDIAGAHQAGLKAALVRTGIHAGMTEAELAGECAVRGVIPDIVLAGLLL